MSAIVSYTSIGSSPPWWAIRDGSRTPVREEGTDSGVAAVACLLSENLNTITIRPCTTARLTVAYEFASGQFTH
jgi:hypothetical protein